MTRIKYSDLPRAEDIAREDMMCRKHGRPHRHSTTVGSKSKAVRMATGKFLDSRSLGLMDDKMDRKPVPTPVFEKIITRHASRRNLRSRLG